MKMITLAQYIFSGILTGLLYSLIGLGLTIVWRSGRIVNLAQGEIIVLSGFVVWSLVAIFSPFWSNRFFFATILRFCPAGKKFARPKDKHY